MKLEPSWDNEMFIHLSWTQFVQLYPVQASERILALLC